MFVKRLVFHGSNGEDFRGDVKDTEFTAEILVRGNVAGDPLITLGDNSGLPFVRDMYARWSTVPGDPAGQDVPVIKITVRFDGRIKNPDGSLIGAIAINLGMEGAEEYILVWI